MMYANLTKEFLPFNGGPRICLGRKCLDMYRKRNLYANIGQNNSP